MNHRSTIVDTAQAVLKRSQSKYLRRGYPWVFANQIGQTHGEPSTGDIVEIVDPEGRTYGRGLYHSDSLIAVRFLTSDPSVAIDAAFFRRRIEQALKLREAAFPDATHYRIAFSESDGLPGTIIDRYADVCTWTTISFGMDQRADWMLDAIEDLVRPRAIVERNDSWLRTKDGLEERTGILRGSYEGPVEIREDDVKYLVDVPSGPKTGFFLDQRFNRQMIRRFAPGRNVLDVFSADGGFGLHSAAAGARSVTIVDVSEAALSRARENAGRSGVFDRMTFVQADALDWLGQMVEQRKRFDLVILDPPAFARSRRHVEFATTAYQRININAMQLLEEGGVLATSSCSQAISEDDFLKIIRYSARRSGTRLRMLFRGSQALDHPVLPSMPETSYLKFFIFQKMGDELPDVVEE